MLMAIGPGIVVTGSVIGSGELINTPVQAAKFGFVLLWAVILSCVIKIFLQIELGRHALVHNRTPFEAFNTLPGVKWRGTSWIGITYLAGSILTALALVMLLAGADEWRQSQLAERTGALADVWLDTLGGLLGVCVIVLWRRHTRGADRKRG